MNRVIKGKYLGRKVIVAGLGISIATGIFIPTVLSDRNLKSFEVLNSDTSNSMPGALVRGAIGGAVLGVAGALAGAVASKTEYLVRIEWVGGEYSVIETDAKGITALNLIFN